MMNLKRIAQWNGENSFSCLYNSYSDYLEEVRSVDPFLTDEEFKYFINSQIKDGTVIIQESENDGKILVTTIIE